MRILIGGGGQVAELVAKRLIREGNEVVLVEQDVQRCQQLEEILDARIVHGNISSIRTLTKGGFAKPTCCWQSPPPTKPISSHA